MPPSKDKEDYWLVRPRTIRMLWIVFIVILAATVLADFFIDHHGEFGIDGTIGFYAWYGFLSCVVCLCRTRARRSFSSARTTTMTASLGGFGYLLTPGLVMMAGGLLLFFLRGAVRDVAVLLAPLAVLALVWLLPDGPSEPSPLARLRTCPVPIRRPRPPVRDGLLVAAFAGGLFALRQERRSRDSARLPLRRRCPRCGLCR